MASSSHGFLPYYGKASDAALWQNRVFARCRHIFQSVCKKSYLQNNSVTECMQDVLCPGTCAESLTGKGCNKLQKYERLCIVHWLCFINNKKLTVKTLRYLSRLTSLTLEISSLLQFFMLFFCLLAFYKKVLSGHYQS